MTSIIEVQNLSYTYPDGRTALQDITLHILQGEKVALVGANGAGKSTLLLQLNGILQGTGTIHVNGIRLEKRSLSRIRALVGLVFQDPDDQLFSPTVFDDVAYGLLYQGLEKAVIEERVAQALSAVHMQGFEQRNPFHLSSGEKKRIAIATVLSMQPQVLVFDEPSAGLDPRARRELMTLLPELPQTMLIATHDLALAAQLTSRAIVLHQGRVVAEGPAADILDNQPLLLAYGLQ